MKSFLLLTFLLSISCFLFAQDDFTELKKTLPAVSLGGSEDIKIDGSPDEFAWQRVKPAVDFVQNKPIPGIAASEKTEVRIFYDNTAIYIGAKLFDSHPDSVSRMFAPRDEWAPADRFAFSTDCYRSGSAGLVFAVSAAGVQEDFIKTDANGNDPSWNAVWESAVKMQPYGWSLEMKIPYSCLRFAKADEQKWGLNFSRYIPRKQEWDFWNEVKPEISGFFPQMGLLTDIVGIEPPTRLFLYPYIALNTSNYNGPDGGWSYGYGAGADIKYGIDDAYTLDVTLVPDFTQVQSDNQVLNLSPFEVRFNETRQFFTEGSELYNKAGLFYSRRIGGRPIGFYDTWDNLQENETLLKNPDKAKLLNATKLTGRNKKGFGIGVLNAITNKTYAVIGTADGHERKFMTNPIANYNVLVLDQNLKNNSNISFTNASVLRFGKDYYDANVSAGNFKINDKKNTWFVAGGAALSQLYFKDSTQFGYQYNINAGKSSGTWQYSVWHSATNKTYDSNDMGFMMFNNISDIGGNVSYNCFKPSGVLNSYSVRASSGYSTIFDAWKFQNYWFNISSGMNFKNQWDLEVWTYNEPITTYDFFEPRIEGRYYTFPKNYGGGFWTSTNQTKPIAASFNMEGRVFENDNRTRISAGTDITYRPNSHITLSGFTYYENMNRNVGAVNPVSYGEIYFGKRDIKTVETGISGSCVFTPYTSLNIRARHYWSMARYTDDLYFLNTDGNLSVARIAKKGKDYNENFNSFNIDFLFRHQFAPGSEITLGWKLAIYSSSDRVHLPYIPNFRNTLGEPMTNVVSVKALYFLDYLKLKRKK